MLLFFFSFRVFNVHIVRRMRRSLGYLAIMCFFIFLVNLKDKINNALEYGSFFAFNFSEKFDFRKGPWLWAPGYGDTLF